MKSQQNEHEKNLLQNNQMKDQINKMEEHIA